MAAVPTEGWTSKQEPKQDQLLKVRPGGELSSTATPEPASTPGRGGKEELLPPQQSRATCDDAVASSVTDSPSRGGSSEQGSEGSTCRKEESSNSRPQNQPSAGKGPRRWIPSHVWARMGKGRGKARPWQKGKAKGKGKQKGKRK